jgi:hypothetical protein
MENIELNELISELERPYLKVIGIVQGFFIGLFLFSPFICIWKDFSYFWKVVLTAIIGILITKFLYFIFKKVIREFAENEIKKELTPKRGFSKFEEKMQKIIDQNKKF